MSYSSFALHYIMKMCIKSIDYNYRVLMLRLLHLLALP